MLFQFGSFESAAGIELPFKIECDALTEDDLSCIARWATPRLPPFGHAIGVPNGGVRLARQFLPWVTPGSLDMLIVDDVWTTGLSMGRFLQRIELHPGWHGFVIWERNEGSPPPSNVRTMFKLTL